MLGMTRSTGDAGRRPVGWSPRAVSGGGHWTRQDRPAPPTSAFRGRSTRAPGGVKMCTTTAPEVEQDPVRGRHPLAADRPRVFSARSLGEDAVGDRIPLALGAAGADHEVVGEGGQRGQLEDDDVGHLLVLGQLDDPAGELERLELAGHGAFLALARRRPGSPSALGTAVASGRWAARGRSRSWGPPSGLGTSHGRRYTSRPHPARDSARIGRPAARTSDLRRREPQPRAVEDGDGGPARDQVGRGRAPARGGVEGTRRAARPRCVASSRTRRGSRHVPKRREGLGRDDEHEVRARRRRPLARHAGRSSVSTV